jgi:hypothetical protein
MGGVFEALAAGFAFGVVCGATLVAWLAVPPEGRR